MEPKIMKRQSQLLKIIVVVSGRTNTELYLTHLGRDNPNGIRDILFGTYTRLVDAPDELTTIPRQIKPNH